MTLLPPGIVVTPGLRQAILNGIDVNSDGAGMAIVADGYVIRERSMDAHSLLDTFEVARSVWHDHWACFHSRLATAKAPAVEHLHPFTVGGDPNTLMFHNGRLPFERDMDPADTRSDSRVLAEDIIPDRAISYLGPDRQYLDLVIGRYNKVAVLTANPRHDDECMIFNRGQWIVTPEGVLHSNPDYLGEGKGWRECRDDDGKLYRWNPVQPGQCPRCHLYGCQWLDWDLPTRRPCAPAATTLPRFRCETDRIAGLK
jgi:hypothetical protein